MSKELLRRILASEVKADTPDPELACPTCGTETEPLESDESGVPQFYCPKCKKII